MVAPKPYSRENNTACWNGQKNIETHSYRMHNVPTYLCRAALSSIYVTDRIKIYSNTFITQRDFLLYDFIFYI